MNEPVIPVVVARLEGSPEMVFASLDDAIAEVKALLQTMIDDESPSAPIHLRMERMTPTEIEQLGDFEGY